jgi:hypothetical protein
MFYCLLRASFLWGIIKCAQEKKNCANEFLNCAHGFIDGLVNGVSLVFTMLRTYTSSKSGLSARKSETNSGDATISLRMVNKDTSRTCITLLCTFTH